MTTSPSFVSAFSNRFDWLTDWRKLADVNSVLRLCARACARSSTELSRWFRCCCCVCWRGPLRLIRSSAWLQIEAQSIHAGRRISIVFYLKSLLLKWNAVVDLFAFKTRYDESLNQINKQKQIRWLSCDARRVGFEGENKSTASSLAANQLT